MGKWKEDIKSEPLDLDELKEHIKKMPQKDPDAVTQRQEPEPTPEVDRRTLISVFHRDEKKKRKLKRANSYYDMTGIVTALFMGAMMFLLFSAFMYQDDPEAGAIYFIVVIIVGMISWLPLGIPIGAIIIDTHLRCKAMRLMMKRNYGLVHLVSKGHRITTMIKDLDESIIDRGESLWGISKGYIYNLSKKNIKHPITSENINYLANVPAIFLDFETMKPLTFHKEETTISPKQLGSSLVGWATVQKKKAVRLQKTTNYMYLIISALVIINMVLLVMILNKMGGF